MRKLATLALLLLSTSPALAESRYAQARELAFETLNHQHESTRASGNACALGLPTDAQRRLAQCSPLIHFARRRPPVGTITNR